jgi:hypothetical protein
MEPTSTLPVRAAGRPWLRRLLILLGMLAVGGYVWQQLPGAAYPTDLTRVGAGTPTLVLAHDNSYIGGAAVMELMNDLRGDYTGRVDFLVAHLQMADGAAFARRFGAQDGTVMLFGADGRSIGILHMPRSVGELKGALDQALAR